MRGAGWGASSNSCKTCRAVAAEYAAAKAAGNFDIAAVIAGEAVGLIHDIPPAAEIVDRIVTEADQILSRTSQLRRGLIG